MSVMPCSRTDANNLDTALSDREIELDPKGYFLIYLDRSSGLICADLYSNSINDEGIACDPKTGKPLPCSGSLKRKPIAIFKGRTAKELCVNLFEVPQSENVGTTVIDRLDHAAYLGREAVRAEIALYSNGEYIQD
jgi:dihydropteroate synthase